MNALYFEKTGSLEQLKLKELPRPSTKSNEALVRIKAAAINPSDPKSVLGKMSETTAPRVPGRDFAGIVMEGPSDWLGKEVFGTGGNLGFGRDGTHAEFAAIPVEALLEKPRDLGFGQAAALGLSYLTSWSALVTAGQAAKEDTVLILGATGAVGSSAVKIARHLGSKRVIGTLRKETDREGARSIPVHDWIVLDGKSLPQELSSMTNNRGADLILDVVGGTLFEEANQCLAHRGRHVVIASNPAQVSFNLVDFYHREARLIGVDTLKLSFAQSAKILAGILPLVNQGVLAAPEFETITLDQAPQAYQAVLNGTARKKQVIRFE
jgi:NADPH:quinone reductase-like Zn-dependent oxidoreductase